MPKGSYFGKKRLYESGIFPTKDQKAHFIATPYKATAESVDARYPFALNTGRLRDQWHGMSRTGTIGTLYGHSPEPCVELSPKDAGRMNLANGDLVHVTSRRGSEIFPVKVSEDIASSQAFIAMHWGSEFISGAAGKNPGRGVNGLTCNVIDPVSGQPELKHSAVKILPANLPWQLVAFGLFPKDEVFLVLNQLRKLLPDFDSAQCVLFGREQDSDLIGVSLKAAHHEDPFEVEHSQAALALKQVIQQFKLDETSTEPVMRYSDKRRGVVRLIRAKERVLSAMLTGPSESLVSTAWLRDYLESGLDAKALGRSLLMSISKPPVEIKPKGKAVCNCFNVSADAIGLHLEKMSPGTSSEDAFALLQTATQCGSNCGSCKPEVKQIISKFLSKTAVTT
jgi:assimilatory nitrate reductase catalytic subunit